MNIYYIELFFAGFWMGAPMPLLSFLPPFSVYSRCGYLLKILLDNCKVYITDG